jgi:hypothetical protein
MVSSEDSLAAHSTGGAHMNRLIVLASVFSVCSCATSAINDLGDGENGSSAMNGNQSCQWPAAADTFDAGANQGCKPRAAFESCEVPNGSIILSDGGVLTPGGGTVTCRDLCSATEYALTCSGADPSEIPAPDPSLNCTILPIPTPSTALFYCCPCSP